MNINYVHIITVGRVLLLIFLLSCTPSQDIYKNPFQTSNSSALTGDKHINSPVYSTHEPPDWIYAVSKDFIVGHGQGKDIKESKDAALNDIKLFIVKSLGETGDFIEVNFVQNTVAGRNVVDSQEGYLMKQQFENKYSPVINLSIDRIEDYYYENVANTVNYYIKYNLNEAALRQIKDNFRHSLQEETARANLIKRSADSLADLHALNSIESIIERYDVITDYLLTTDLQSKDSLKLIRTLHEIIDFLGSIQIRIYEHNPGANVRFGLCSGQIPVRSDSKPDVICEAIIIDALTKQDDSWELRYRSDPNLPENSAIEIVYELPYDRISTRLEIQPLREEQKFKVINPILLYDFHKDSWTGNLKDLTLRIIINSDSRESYKLKALDLELHVNEDITPMIMIEHLDVQLNKGMNILTRTIKCDLPSRFFMSRDIDCDLKLYYDAMGMTKVEDINNVHLAINNY
jgi:hypothetical protein